MKKLILPIIALFVLSANAQLKVAVADLEKIGPNMDELKEAEQLYRQIEMDELADLDSSRKQLEQEITSFQKQQSMMTGEAKATKEKELSQKSMQFQQRQQQLQFKLQQQQAELLEPIREKITNTVSRIAKEKGFNLVLDSNNPYLLHYDKKMDITFEVLAQMEKETE